MKKNLFLVLIGLTLGAECFAQSSWKMLPNSPFNIRRHDDVFFVDASTGWIVNGQGNVFKTTDGGESWSLQFSTDAYLRSVGFLDAQRGWVGTLNRDHILYTTSDGGLTWTEVTNIPEPKPLGICGISAVDDTVVYASGRYNSPARVIKTTDGGVSWTSINMDQYANGLVDCYFLSADSGFVVGWKGDTHTTGIPVILFTVDGGKTWLSRYTGKEPSEICWKISFPSAQVGYVSLEIFHDGPTFFLKTSDGGITWAEKKFADNRLDVQGIGFLNETTGWLGGWSLTTFETVDAGQSWHSAGFGMNINRFRFLSDTLGYAVGQRVYKYSKVAPSAVASPDQTSAPRDFRLEQNHPNPFNPATTIRYSVARTGPVRLQVFNLPGQLVATLVDEVKSTGEHHVKFDASNLPSGVYFYRLLANQKSLSRKMVLAK